MWRPKTFFDAQAAEEPVSLEVDRLGRVRCPNCGTCRHAAAIVDVRHLPIPEEWACDGCWTQWERTGRVVDGGPGFVSSNRKGRGFEWRKRWAVAHSAPPEVTRKWDQLIPNLIADR